MIVEYLRNGKINKKALIAENYKRLGLNENQYAIILITLELEKTENSISTPKQLSQYMTLTTAQIELELKEMTKRDLLQININTEKESFDFSPLYKKLELIFQINLIKEMANINFVEFINNYFDITLNNAEIAIVSNFAKKNNATTLLLQILIDNKFDSAHDFITYLDKFENSDRDVPEIMDYDWLRS
jgi:DNA replication protein